MTHGPLLLFLDTEWADLDGEAVVSLALIGADGQLSFYAERCPLLPEPTGFVSQTVFPLLNRGDAAKTDLALVHELRAFLASLQNPFVLFDYPNDGTLLRAAIAGFRLLPSELAGSAPPPINLNTMLITDPLVGAIIEDWFLANPEEAVRRHHALVDANALRVAWLAANGRIDAPWSFAWRHKLGT